MKNQCVTRSWWIQRPPKPTFTSTLEAEFGVQIVTSVEFSSFISSDLAAMKGFAVVVTHNLELCPWTSMKTCSLFSLVCIIDVVFLQIAPEIDIIFRLHWQKLPKICCGCHLYFMVGAPICIICRVVIVVDRVKSIFSFEIKYIFDMGIFTVE